MAAVWKAPVVFVCENNQYMEYTPIGAVTAVEHPAADRASRLRPRADRRRRQRRRRGVRGGARRAVDRARAGDGPSLIEAVTYRHGGHSRADPGKYRPDDEVAAWKARDPIPALPRAARGGRRRRRPTLDAIEAETREAVAAAEAEARAAPGAVAPTCSRPRSGPTEARRGGTDVSRGDRRGIAQEMERDPIGRADRRGRRRGRRRVQADRGPVRPSSARTASATRRSASRRSSGRRWAPR